MADMSLADGIDLLQRRALYLKIMLLIGLALLIPTLAGGVAELNGTIALGRPEPTTIELLYSYTLIFALPVTIVTIIVFCMWKYRAAANVATAEVPGFEYTPGWAIGWYFIPIANLFKPFAAMRQLWNASHGAQYDGLDHNHGLLGWWWASWIISNITANISMRLALRADTPEQYLTSVKFGLASSLVSLLLFPALLLIVDRITAAQRQRLNTSHIFA